MKLTAELSLSQVKGNKKRTTGTILATALSTALLTAVMCFVTSGNKMLVDFLGPGYGDYGGTYLALLLVPAILLGLLIFFMSVTVISNIFESSAGKRLGEFGVLKCVGATRKQVKEAVIYESLWISMIAVPAGLILGTLIGYIGVLVAGRYIEEFNELSKSIIMSPITFYLPFHVSVWTYIFAAFFSMVVVLASASKPAKKAGKLAAIQCIKGGEIKEIGKTKIRNNKLVEKVLGYEGTLGYRNIARNKTAYKSTVRALALSIMLILMTGSLSNQAGKISDWMGSMGDSMEVEYVSSMDYEINEISGKEETIINAPIPFDKAEEITEKLNQYPGVDVVGLGTDGCTYNAILDKSTLSDEFLEVPGIIDGNGESEAMVLTLDCKSYQELCKRAGVEPGSNILINNYEYNAEGVWKRLVPYKEDVKEVTLINASNEITKLEISACISNNLLPEGLFSSLVYDPVWVIVPESDSRGFNWLCDPKDDQEYTEFAKEIMDGYYPIISEYSYREQGYTVRIARRDQMIKVLNVAIVLGEVVLMGLIVLLIIMGFASVISTLSSNMGMRKREFAVLKSVGMTHKSLEKMIYSESIICIFRAAFWGVLTGVLMPWLINLSIRQLFPVRYQFTPGAFLLGIILIAGLVITITKIELGKLDKQSIIEDIRMDLM